MAWWRASSLLIGSLAAVAGELPRATVTLPSGTVLEAEVASDPESRERGLMFRSEEQFQPGQAMVFLFPEPAPLGFWMKNVNFPIDIVWLTADFRIVHVEANVPPCSREPCKTYGPSQEAQVVVELYRGTVAREKLGIGDALLLGESPAP